MMAPPGLADLPGSPDANLSLSKRRAEAVLRQLRGLAAPGGRLHISIPNARHFTLIADLVLRGTFGYRDWGHRDSTHLRWYTRRDLVAMVERGGWRVAWTVGDTSVSATS